MAPTKRLPISTTVVASIFLLRFAIGWHFYSDGTKKLKDPDFRAAYFLDSAVGPFAGWFHDLIPDAFGVERLDLDARRAAWKAAHEGVVNRLNADAKKPKADQILAEHVEKLDYFVAIHGPEIRQHMLEVQRYLEANRNPNFAESFGRDWLRTERARLRNAIRPWINDLDQMDAAFRKDLLDSLQLEPPAMPRRTDIAAKGWVDYSVTWMVLMVGVCLLLGLFTGPAALVGIVFLLSVLATQPFWVSGANLSYLPYQLVEIAGLVVLTTTRAGRFAGLDFFLHRETRT